jgi:hypothetical protein
LDEDFNIVNKLLAFDQQQRFVFEETVGPKNLHAMGREFSFANIFSDSVLYFTAEGIKNIAQFGFPRFEPTLTEDMQQPLKLDPESYLYPLFFSFNDQWESLNYLKGEKPYWLLKEKGSKQWMKFDSFHYKGITLPAFAKIYGEYVVFMVSDEAALSSIDDADPPYPFKQLINYESPLVIGIIPIADLLP